MNPTFRFGRHILNQIEMGINKEWLETNGLGSYAMGTILGINTRRYHSLFMKCSIPDLKRTILVNRVEESVLIHGKKIDCSCQEYPGAISPQGHLLLENFVLNPFPRWIYAIDDTKLEKIFFMRTGEQTSVLIYRHLLGTPIKLIVQPFFSCRDQHVLIHENQQFNNAVQIDKNQIRCAAEGNPEFFTTAVAPSPVSETIKIYQEGYWYKNLVYAIEESEMGRDYQEDLYSPGQIHVELSAGQSVGIIFSDQPLSNVDLNRWLEQEIFIRKKMSENLPIQGVFAKQCAIMADRFVIRNKDEYKIIRGYPGHEDTIRESLMSLPGIFLSTGRIEEARSMLFHCVRLLHQGLLPYRFTDAGASDYHSVDSSLWLIWAIQKYWGTTKDQNFINEMKPHIEKIIQSFINGIKMADSINQCEIIMESDNLIWGNSNRSPLTWMDGQAGNWIATLRKGKPVEVQALWYNALQFYSEIALKAGGTDNGWTELAKKVRENFNALFWNSQNNYLYDVIDGNSREGSIRPNALYAISMPYEILDTDKFRPVMETAWRTLYTSLGLRTLSPSEPHYHGICVGEEKNRISAIYNGTVLPFLIGSFLTAYFKTFGRDQKSKEEASYFLSPFVTHLSDAGLGTISEFFDGNSPHNSRGAIADARSLAEILRVMKEEGLEL